MSASFREDYEKETLERLAYELKRIALELELLDMSQYAAEARKIVNKIVEEQSC